MDEYLLQMVLFVFRLVRWVTNQFIVPTSPSNQPIVSFLSQAYVPLLLRLGEDGWNHLLEQKQSRSLLNVFEPIQRKLICQPNIEVVLVWKWNSVYSIWVCYYLTHILHLLLSLQI